MRLGLIGCGKMGRALLEGILAADVVEPSDVVVFDAYEPSLSALSRELGVAGAADNAEVMKGAETVLLCVKPGDLLPMLKEVGDASVDTLLVSIAAGVTLRGMAEAAPKARVIRVMPNTPALIGKGASGYALGASATAEDGEAARRLLEAVGIAHEFPEKLLDAVTGLSGSGPAYVYLMIEALADGGVRMGLPKDQAIQLASQTVAGAAEMVMKTSQHPAVLRDQVTSPGGTTIAGLATLEAAGVRSALIEAVRAATEKSEALGKS